MKPIVTSLSIILLSMGVLCIQSCGTYYYAATKQNVMKFKEKGDVNATIGAGMEFENDVQNVSVGYAISNHWAVNATYNNLPRLKDHDYIWDNEVILFHKVSKSVLVANNFGFSFGKLNSGGEYFNLNVYREFLQPSFGFSNDFVELAFSVRFTNLHYSLNQVKNLNRSNGKTFREEFELGDVGLRNYLFSEPAITAGLGYKWIMFRMQYTQPFKLDNDYLNYYSGPLLYFSLNARFNVFDVGNVLRKKAK
tara:strand:- start:162962 stop:163714 length:753 start_codon:yes stop_codon:yes gene_type:complete